MHHFIKIYSVFKKICCTVVATLINELIRFSNFNYSTHFIFNTHTLCPAQHWKVKIQVVTHYQWKIVAYKNNSSYNMWLFTKANCKICRPLYVKQKPNSLTTFSCFSSTIQSKHEPVKMTFKKLFFLSPLTWRRK